MSSRPPDDGAPPPGWGRPTGPPPGQVWQPPPGDRRNPLLVIGGILLGLGLGFLVMPWLGIWLSSGATSSTGADSLGGIGIILGFGLPIVVGVGMLLSRRLRKAGAGVLLGISIGMIVGSASCLGVWGLFIVALSGAHG
jgi:hypothetical protein